MRAGGAALLGVAAILLAAGCGDADEDTSGATVDIARYCEITQQLDEAGTEEFEELEQDPDATREDFEAAERRLYEENEDLIAEGQRVAPPEIQDELEILVAGLRSRAGLGDEAPDRADARAAERAIEKFEKENCAGA
jgi:hypothetical protein